MRIDAYLRESPLFAVGRAARRLDAMACAALEADDLSLLEGLLLAALFFEAPRPVKPSQLAEAFETTRGHISQCLSSLEAKGLLQRQIDPSDARVFLLALKPQGKRTAQRVIAAFDRLQKAFEHTLGKSDLKETLKRLRQMENNIQ